MMIGYARESTALAAAHDQNLDMQIDGLKQAGCEKIFREKVSSAKERPELVRLVESLRPGDTVVVWKLDRLGRSLKELIGLIIDFQKKEVRFKSLNDAIDTTTFQGRLVFNIFASLAEFERDIIRERTRVGLTAARARGRMGGKPKGLNKEAMAKAYAAKTLYDQREKTVEQIAQVLGISRATVYRYINAVKDL